MHFEKVTHIHHQQMPEPSVVHRSSGHNHTPDLPLTIPHDAGIAADLLQMSLDLLRQTLSIQGSVNPSNQQKKSLKRIQQSLFLWGESHEVPSGILDSVLQKSKHLQKVVVTVLSLLIKRILYGKANLCSFSGYLLIPL
jgi:hypothetical protein